MPTCFKFDGFTVYFWSRENGEPVHVHASRGVPSAHATKFWLTSEGGARLASNGSGLSRRELGRLQRVIIANYDMIVDMWRERFGYVSFI